MEQEKKTVWTFEFDAEQAKKSVIDYEVQLNKLKAQKKEIEAQNKKGELSEEAYAEAILATNSSIKKNADAQKNLINLQSQNKGSVSELALQLKNAKKALEEMADAYTINADGSLQVSEAFETQQEKVKNLEDSLKSLKNTKTFEDQIKSISFFGVSLGQAEEGVKSFFQNGISGAIKSVIQFGKTLLTSPLGIFAVVLGAIITALSRSQKAIEFFRKATAGLGQVLDLVLQPLDLLADGLIFLAEKASGAFSVLTNLFGGVSDETTKNAFELEGAIIRIEKAEKRIERERKQSLATQEKLKTLRDDESKGTVARLKANQELAREIEASFKKDIDNQEEKLQVLQAQLKIETNSVDQKEIQEKIDEQLTKLAETKEELEGRRVEQITNQNSLLREQSETVRNINTLTLDLAIAQGKINADSKEALDKRIQFEKDALKDRLKEVKTGTIEEQQVILESELAIANLQKDFREKSAENYKAYTEKIKEADDKLREETKLINELSLQTEVTRLENLANIENEFNTKSLELFEKGEISKVQFQNTSQLSLIEAKKKLIDFEASEELKEVERTTKNKELIKAKTLQVQQDTNLAKLALDNEYNTKSLALEAQRLANEAQLKNDGRLEQAKKDEIFFQNELEVAKRRGQSTFELEKQLQAERFGNQSEQLKADLEAKLITEGEFASLERQAFEQNETFKTDIAIREKQKEIEAQRNLEDARLSIAQSVSEGLTAIAGENKTVKAAAFAFEQAVALTEAGIALQRQLTNINTTGSTLDVPVPGPGIAYRIAAGAGAVARMGSIIAKIKAFKFAEGGYTGEGFGTPDETGFKIAGFVHQNEYVMPSWLLETQSGNQLMREAESMRLRGYAEGGGVDFTAPTLQNNQIETTKYLVEAISNIQVNANIQEFMQTANRVRNIEMKAGF